MGCGCREDSETRLYELKVEYKGAEVRSLELSAKSLEGAREIYERGPIHAHKREFPEPREGEAGVVVYGLKEDGTKIELLRW